ncbi:MAG: rod-binding protein [Burkholderiaceae bacterium]|nr:rod-binding protein [Burkholderiaceae bacterium]
MSTNGIPSPQSYLDFSGLGELRHRAAKDGEGALRETAKQFEALFIQMMMKSMRDASFKSDLLQSDSQDTYQDMFDKEVSVSLAQRGGFGLADMLTQQLGKSLPKDAATAPIESKPMAMPAHWRQRTGDDQ